MTRPSAKRIVATHVKFTSTRGFFSDQDRRQKSGTFAIGHDLPINRLGFGAMRIAGPGVRGEPEDLDEALRVLRCLPEIGVTFVDTADSYGSSVSEELIAEALHPYNRLTIVTTGGLVRYPDKPNLPQIGDPHYLRQCAT